MHDSATPLTARSPRRLPAEHGRVKVVRPLLGFRKAELEGYCQRGGLPYVTDPTNSNLSYHRHATAGLE